MAQRAELTIGAGAGIEEWEALGERLARTPFEHPGWLRIWHESYGRGEPILLTARAGAELLGALPLERRLGNLRSPTNWHTPQFAPLAEDRRVLEALLGAAAARTSGSLDLSFVDDRSEVPEALRALPSPRSGAILERTVLRSPYIPLEGTSWEDYLGALSSKKRYKLRRARRDLEAMGEVTVRVETGERDLERHLRQGFEIEASGWKGEEGTAIVSSSQTRRFYERIAAWAAAKGWLRLIFIEVDGRPAAFAYALEDGSAHYDVKNGFHPDFASASPGFVLASVRIERACELGLGSYEFLGAANPFKLDMTDTCRERLRLQLFKPGPRGRLERLTWERGRPIAKRALGRLRKLRG